METFHIQLPPKKRLDFQDRLSEKHGIEATISGEVNGRCTITVERNLKVAKGALEEVLRDLGGYLIQD